jgi:hypothetical protein
MLTIMAVDRKRDRSKRTDNTASKAKKQLVVVGLLVLGLILALVTQPKKDDEVVPVQPIVTLTQLKPEAMQVTAIAEPHPSVLQVQSLASIELETWIDQNPFASSHAETINKSFSDANGLLRIQAVYGQGDDAVALIGTQLVRVGESLPDGRRVTRISADGIELSR